MITQLPAKTSKSLRLLCAADLHLGRSLPILPGDLPGDRRGNEHFIIHAWENLVEFALAPSSSIDAVLLAGDIFDGEDDLYEAVFHFEKGIGRLIERGIPVIAIAGNHDAKLFARRSFFAHLPGFHYLGQGGRWETLHLDLGHHRLRIDGWSFPDSEFAGNPLQSVPSCGRKELAIGIVHGECPGQKGSIYAPFNVRDFASIGHRAFVLGHVHIPQVVLDQPHVFYCGSLQGLDCSEHHLHGVTLLDMDQAGELQRHFVPLAPLLWHQQTVIVQSEWDGELHTLLESAIQEAFKRGPAPLSLRKIVARFFLEGRVRDYSRVVQQAKELEGQHLTSVFHGHLPIPCWIEKIIVGCQPAFDLSLLAKGEDMVSQLARRLVALQNGEEERGLVETSRAFLDEKLRSSPYLASILSEEELQRELLHTGYSLLAELLKQKERS